MSYRPVKRWMPHGINSRRRVNASTRKSRAMFDRSVFPYPKRRKYPIDLLHRRWNIYLRNMLRSIWR